jgi:P27 family predicted phage terminase small subunit
MGVLTFVDEPSMASLCQAVADFRAAVEEIRADGMTVSTAMGGLKAHPCITMRNDAARRIALFGALFGMDPSSRSRLSVVKPPEDPLANFLGGKKKPSGA